MARPKIKIPDNENDATIEITVNYNGDRVKQEISLKGLTGTLLKRERTANNLLAKAVSGVRFVTK